ncbi:MAG: M20/M25/M40 family metallo-hydrolase [Candidatus Eisenbacteria bacterium]
MWRKRTGRSLSARGGPFRSAERWILLLLPLLLVPGAAGGQAPPEPGAGPPDRDLFLERVRAAPSLPLRALMRAPSADDSLLALLVSLFDADSLRRTVADLVAFGTRYEYAAEQESAAEYLSRRFDAMGYETVFRPYALSEWDLFKTTFTGDGQRGWMVVSHADTGAVLGTSDGGATWTVDHRTPFRLNDVSAAGESIVWAVGEGGRVIRGDGSGWALVDTLGTDPLPAVDFLDEEHGMILSRVGVVYRTEDGGETWTADALTTSFLMDVEYVDPRHAWACGANGTIFAWGPSGWEDQPSGTHRAIQDLDFRDSTFGIAALSEASALIWEGAGWRRAPTGVAFGYAAGAASDSTVWLAGLDALRLTHVIRSDDRGNSWKEAVFPFGILWRSVNLIHFGSENEVLLGGYDGLFVRSGDGGATWSLASLPEAIVHVSRNVYADLRGCSEPESLVILSAHYDSYSLAAPYTDAPGADDDASGVAAVLEAARVFASSPAEKTLRFLLFSGEELGLLGSTAYAIEARERGEKIAADIQIDMIGIPGEPLLVLANEPSSWILVEASGIGPAVAPDLPFSMEVSPFSTYSDHASFWANGYPAVQISETIGDDNPLHTPGDTLGNLDFDFLTRSARFAGALAARIAGIGPAAPGSEEAIVWRPFPNPSPGILTIPLVASDDAAARIDIFDLSGRLVRRLSGEGTGRCASCAIEWDGRDRGGRQVSPGVYLLRMEADDRRWTRKVIVVR